MRMSMCLRTAAAFLFATLALPGAATAGPSTCSNVRFSDVGWTDITSTTAITSRILKGLGYTPVTQLLSVALACTCR